MWLYPDRPDLFRLLLDMTQATSLSIGSTRTGGYSDFPARGRVIGRDGDMLVFHPVNTVYQLHLSVAEGIAAPTDRPIDAIVRVRARKVWTVPSGGLFISPIFGPPRTIQGRVRYLDERQMVINAGTMIRVEFPNSDSGFDLNSGPISIGTIVNVTALPGASFSLLAKSKAFELPT
jgi:hypothetical protein